MAATLDVLTLVEAKAAVNITDAAFDTELASYITAISQRLDDHAGPIVQRTVTAEAHDGAGPVFWPTHTPVASVSAVLEYARGVATELTAETVTTAGGYLLKNAGTHNSQIRRRASWADRAFTGGAGNVLVTYVAGRFADTASVSPKFKQAAAKTLSWLWRGDQGAGTATFGAADGTSLFGLGFALPNSVVQLLVHDARPPMVG